MLSGHLLASLLHQEWRIPGSEAPPVIVDPVERTQGEALGPFPPEGCSSARGAARRGEGERAGRGPGRVL